MYALLIAGIALLATILALFWLKDALRSPLLARLAYSGFVARLAVVAAAMSVLGTLLILGDWISH